VIDEHLARVSVDTRALLECGAILGREFSPADIARLAAAPGNQVATALAEAEEAALVSRAAQGRLAFVHVLVRDRLVERLSPSRRAELHCRAAEAILEGSADLVSAAHHFIEGHTAASVDRVLEMACDAAERSLVRLAFEEAVDIGERALALVEGQPPTRRIAALLAIVAEAHFRAGAIAKGRERCIEAGRVAKSLGASDLAARAALAYGTHLASAVVDPVMVSLLEAALEGLGTHDHPVRARVMARLASALVPPASAEDRDRVLGLGRAAIAMARRLGDEDALLYTMYFGGSAFGYQISREERAVLIEESVVLARKLGNRTSLLHVLGFRAGQLREEGLHAEADALEAEWQEVLTHFPQPQYQWRRFIGPGVRAALDGDFEAARQAAEQMRQAGEAAGVPQGRVAWALLQIALAHSSGDPSSIAPVADKIIEIMGKLPTLLPYLAWALAAVGRKGEAAEMLSRVSRELEGFPWLIAAADATTVIGSAALADRFYEPLSGHQYSNRIFWGPVASFCFGPTPRVLGDLAMLLGRVEDALRHYEDAIAFCERVGSKPLLALSQRGRDAALAAMAGHSGASIPVAAERSVETGQAGTTTSRPERVPVLRREGDVWAFERDGAPPTRLKDGKGLRYLERLLATPGQEIHVLELVGSDEAGSDAGAVLDGKAKAQYRLRLEDLKDQLEEATRNGDPGRAERAQAEIDAIADQLAAAVGLGGRDRKAASNVERARINVQRRVRDVLDRVAAQDSSLGRYLEASIRTGVYCCFEPVEK
jgi:hypothetical protein